jgi:hypothetical protein
MYYVFAVSIKIYKCVVWDFFPVGTNFRMSNCTFCKAEYIDAECQTCCFQSNIEGRGTRRVWAPFRTSRPVCCCQEYIYTPLRWSLRNHSHTMVLSYYHSSFPPKTSSNMSPYPCLGPGIVSAADDYYHTCCRDMTSDVSNISSNQTCFEY